jgi:hypothetical protein
VSLLGDAAREQQLQGELTRRWPPEGFPVHIDVRSAQDTTAIAVGVWNGTSIDVRGTAHPEQFVRASETPTVAGVLSEVAGIIEELRNRGEL